MEELIKNKVAESGLVTISPEDFLPEEPVALFDLKDYLYMGLVLKEKEFRQTMEHTNWECFRNKNVGITCSADAIVPMWAYMLVATRIQPIAKQVFFGNEAEVNTAIALQNIARLPIDEYKDKRIVIKGCGEKPVSEHIYVALTTHLLPFVKSIMYGEPCSTVPIFKKKG